jgi:putative transposase
MARIARVVIPGVPHDITQRGNNGGDVFEADEEREAYLALLQQYMAKRGAAL